MHSFKTPEFSRVIYYIFELPPGLFDQEIRQRTDDRPALVNLLTMISEAFGILVFRGDIRIDLFEEFFSGPIPYSREILHSYVE